MRNFFRQFTKTDYIFFTVCALAYFFLIRQYIPVLDDFRYHYCYHEWPQPIRSFSDILKSQAYHYTHVNGRFIVHCIVQYFCSFGGLLSYYICSSLIFVLLLMSATVLIKRDLPQDMKETGSIRCIFLLLLLLFVPQIGIFFFGSVAFTVNYMWSTAVYLCFLLLYFKVKDNVANYNLWECLLLILLGVLCGSWQESFSICIAGALGLYYIFHIKEMRGALLWLLVGFAIGAMIGVFAPGNFVRITSLEVSEPLGVYDIIQMLKHRLFFQSLLIVTIVSLIIDLWKHKPLFICRNWLYYTSILISFLFAACITYHDLYQLTIVQIFSILLTAKFLYEYCYPALLHKWDRCVAITLVGINLIIYIPSLCLRQIASESYKEAETSILNNSDGIAYDTRLEYFNYVLIPQEYRFWADYINGVYFQTLYTAPSLLSLRLTGDATPLYHTILPIHLDSIQVICMNEKNKIANNIFSSPDHAYVIVRVDKSEERNYTIVQRTIAANTISRLKDKLKKRNYKEDRYPLQQGQVIRKITIGEYTYFIVPSIHIKGRIVEQQWLEES